MNRILVTGASGFIGTALCKRLLSDGYKVTAALRRPVKPFLDEGIKTVNVGNIDAQTDWSDIVENVDAVIHLAARAHVISDHASDSIDAYRKVNVTGTAKLAQHAVLAGIKRFVYLSSVKVNGEENAIAYKEQDRPFPEDAYGISKMEGEAQLKAIAGSSDMDFVIIRPPLVYGPGVKANFLTLMKLVDRKVPLPLARVSNRRSMIYLGNLVDCIYKCVIHPAAAGQTYMVSDDRDVTTPELIRLIAAALKTRSVLFPFPQLFLHAVGNLVGKGDAVKRLLGSLTVDISKIKRDLIWTPPFSVEFGLLKTAQWFKENQNKFAGMNRSILIRSV